MKKRRIKKSVIKKGIILLTAIILIFITIGITKTLKYHKTEEYKLKKIGYKTEEINKIKNLNQDNKNYIINNEYNSEICKIIEEKYYIEENLEKYIKYQKQNPNKEINQIISLVNVGIESKQKANIENKTTILVNKQNYLEETYEPENINTIPSRYAYSDNKTTDEALTYYKKMFNAAEKDNIDLIISSGYRSYNEQKETYEYYKKTKGEKYAQTHVAKPGESEHQTGLAFDILTTNANLNNFEQTKEFNWLKENAYKYGFILRYPKEKEEITGYDYEPWHYRYVGEKVAAQIKEENITFDEYYAFYINR